MIYRNFLGSMIVVKIVMSLSFLFGVTTAISAENIQTDAECDALYFDAPGGNKARSCVYLQLEKYEGDVTRLVNKIGAQLEKADDGYHDRKSIEVAQRSWLEYRDANCNLDYLGPSLPHFVVQFYRCQRDMTKKRAGKLQEYLKCIDGSDCKIEVSDL